MLERIVQRISAVPLIDLALVATTEEPEDDKTVEECKRLNVEFFRGSEQDVLNRYYQAALKFGAHNIIRITADCPLIDPGVVMELICFFNEKKSDYAINALPQTYPRGQVAEIMTMNALTKAWKEAKHNYERTHVTPYIYESEQFRVSSFQYKKDVSHHRWTVDTEEDLCFVREVYLRMENRNDFEWEEVLNMVEEDPALAGINNHIKQKDLKDS